MDPEKQPEKPVAGRIALVTGASRGIGRGLAVGLGEQGALVLITGRVAGTLEKTAELVRAAGGACETHVVDHADDKAMHALFRKLRARLDETGARLDIVVNNAYSGISFLLGSLAVPAWEKSARAPEIPDTARPLQRACSPPSCATPFAREMANALEAAAATAADRSPQLLSIHGCVSAAAAVRRIRGAGCSSERTKARPWLETPTHFASGNLSQASRMERQTAAESAPSNGRSPDSIQYAMIPTAYTSTVHP